MWVDGAIHGNEINGITCSLYLAWYLLTRYDYDPFVHDLVDRTTFYILPGLNVDANDSYVRFPNTENNPREPYRPADDDGDGLYDEDQTEDVDGDGELSMMYVEDPAGRLQALARQAAVRPRRRSARGRSSGSGASAARASTTTATAGSTRTTSAARTRTGTFPSTGASSGLPLSAERSRNRNVFEFQLAHPNIFASFHYHNTGRLIMFEAPPAVRAGRPAPSREQARGSSRPPSGSRRCARPNHTPSSLDRRSRPSTRTTWTSRPRS